MGVHGQCLGARCFGVTDEDDGCNPSQQITAASGETGRGGAGACLPTTTNHLPLSPSLLPFPLRNPRHPPPPLCINASLINSSLPPPPPRSMWDPSHHAINHYVPLWENKTQEATASIVYCVKSPENRIRRVPLGAVQCLRPGFIPQLARYHTKVFPSFYRRLCLRPGLTPTQHVAHAPPRSQTGRILAKVRGTFAAHRFCVLLLRRVASSSSSLLLPFSKGLGAHSGTQGIEGTDAGGSSVPTSEGNPRSTARQALPRLRGRAVKTAVEGAGGCRDGQRCRAVWSGSVVTGALRHILSFSPRPPGPTTLNPMPQAGGGPLWTPEPGCPLMCRHTNRHPLPQVACTLSGAPDNTQMPGDGSFAVPRRGPSLQWGPPERAPKPPLWGPVKGGGFGLVWFGLAWRAPGPWPLPPRGAQA